MHLADVGVGLGPVLADFEGEPGAEVEVALADEVGGAERGARRGRRRGRVRQVAKAAWAAVDGGVGFARRVAA